MESIATELVNNYNKFIGYDNHRVLINIEAKQHALTCQTILDEYNTNEDLFTDIIYNWVYSEIKILREGGLI